MMMQRPSFESLGCAGDRSNGIEEGNGLSHKVSFPSAGSFPSSSSLKNSTSFASSSSLKRSASEISIDDEEGRAHTPPINPELAQAAAAETIESVLGFVRTLIPVPPTTVTTTFQEVEMQVEVAIDALNCSIPMPTPVSVDSIASIHLPVGAAFDPSPVTSASNFTAVGTDTAAPETAPVVGHFRKPSFLPPHLNVVPEESFLPENAEDFFFSLTEEDWAIGEGFDMDSTN